MAKYFKTVNNKSISFSVLFVVSRKYGDAFGICHSPRKSVLLHFSMNPFLTSALSFPGQNAPVTAVDVPALLFQSAF